MNRIGRIRELAAQGAPPSRIAREVGTSPHAVMGIAGMNGIAFRPRVGRKTEPEKRERDIIAFYKLGKTLAETGVEFGICRERVRQICARWGAAEGARGRVLLNKVEFFAARERKRGERKTVRDDAAARKAAIISAYLNTGKSMREIANEFGMSCASALNSLMRCNNVPFRRPKQSEKMIEAYKKGMRTNRKRV